MSEAIRENGLRSRLRAGKAAFGVFATEFFTPGFCRIAANAGAEFVLFDMEHGGVGIDTLKQQYAYARGTGLALQAVGKAVIGTIGRPASASAFIAPLP